MPSYDFSVVNQTRNLAQLLAHFQIVRPVIIALTFGATIAANFAITFPEHVRSVVINTWSKWNKAMMYFCRWEG